MFVVSQLTVSHNERVARVRRFKLITMFDPNTDVIPVNP